MRTTARVVSQSNRTYGNCFRAFHRHSYTFRLFPKGLPAACVVSADHVLQSFRSGPRCRHSSAACNRAIGAVESILTGQTIRGRPIGTAFRSKGSSTSMFLPAVDVSLQTADWPPMPESPSSVPAVLFSIACQWLFRRRPGPLRHVGAFVERVHAVGKSGFAEQAVIFCNTSRLSPGNWARWVAGRPAVVAAPLARVAHVHSQFLLGIGGEACPNIRQYGVDANTHACVSGFSFCSAMAAFIP